MYFLKKANIIKKNLQIKKHLHQSILMSRIALIGKKIGMTTLFDDSGIIPVTLIKIVPNVVIEVRDYNGKHNIVIGGNGEIKNKKINKPQKDDLLKKNIKACCDIKEFKIGCSLNIAPNTEMSVGDYLNGAIVDVRSCSIGKGFQGAMKKWGFGGLPATHGVSLTHRSLGSTGNRTLPGRVFKGKKMSGHMGNKNVCVQNMCICKVDKDANIVAVKGSVPGKKNTIVYITNAVKKYIENDNVINGLVCEG